MKRSIVGNWAVRTWRNGLVAALGCLGGGEPGILAAALGPGAVDPGFAPPPSLAGPRYGIWPVGSHLYLGGMPLRRLTVDGQEDAGWVPPPETFGPYGPVAARADGGLVIRSLVGGAVVQHIDGTTARWTGLPGGGSIEPIFPQPDGGLLLPVPARANPDGTLDRHYGAASQLESAPFGDASGYRIQGGLTTSAAVDGAGRMIVVGNFIRSGGRDRLGVARLGPDGIPDDSWNPGAALGVGIDEQGELTALPASAAVGPGDSVVVGIRGKAANGAASFRLGTVTATGAVGPAWPWRWVPVNSPGVPFAVQPDGRVLVADRAVQGWPAGVTERPRVMRLNADGTFDPTFSVQLEGGSTGVSALALDASGWLWLSGDFTAINGVERPGLARVRAYDPVPRVPTVEALRAPVRVGTNEVLELVASVTGEPVPSLQWYRDGVALPGATYPGLRLSVSEATVLGEFRLVASNRLGTAERVFPTVRLATRSRARGAVEASWNRSLAPFVRVTRLVPAADGRIWVAGGTDDETTPSAVIGRLQADGTFDAAFGEGGWLGGDGMVEQVVPTGAGTVWVAGRFTRLGGQPAPGLAELDARGVLVPHVLPVADVPQYSAVLPLPDGGMMVAGWFTRLAGSSAFRLARLRSDFTVDPTFHSPLEPWQVVDVLALDGRGRLLIGGERIYTDVPLTNAVPTGVQRLGADGAPDPGFQRSTSPARAIVVEPEGTLWVGYPFRRLGTNGEVVTTFEALGVNFALFNSFEPNIRFARSADGGGWVPTWPGLSRPYEITRWDGAGRRDDGFQCVVGTAATGPQVEAMAAMPDGSLLVATRLLGTVAGMPDPEVARRLIRIAADSDSRLTGVGVSGGQLRATLATQAGRSYRVVRREDVAGGTWETVGDVEGDGYLQELATPANAGRLFLQVQRR